VKVALHALLAQSSISTATNNKEQAVKVIRTDVVLVERQAIIMVIVLCQRRYTHSSPSPKEKHRQYHITTSCVLCHWYRVDVHDALCERGIKLDCVALCDFRD